MITPNKLTMLAVFTFAWSSLSASANGAPDSFEVEDEFLSQFAQDGINQLADDQYYETLELYRHIDQSHQARSLHIIALFQNSKIALERFSSWLGGAGKLDFLNSARNGTYAIRVFGPAALGTPAGWAAVILSFAGTWAQQANAQNISKNWENLVQKFERERDQAITRSEKKRDGAVSRLRKLIQEKAAEKDLQAFKNWLKKNHRTHYKAPIKSLTLYGCLLLNYRNQKSWPVKYTKMYGDGGRWETFWNIFKEGGLPHMFEQNAYDLRDELNRLKFPRLGCSKRFR